MPGTPSAVDPSVAALAQQVGPSPRYVAWDQARLEQPGQDVGPRWTHGFELGRTGGQVRVARLEEHGGVLRAAHALLPVGDVIPVTPSEVTRRVPADAAVAFLLARAAVTALDAGGSARLAEAAREADAGWAQMSVAGILAMVPKATVRVATRPGTQL